MSNYENVQEYCDMDGAIPDCEKHKVIPDQYESAMAAVIPDCETNKTVPYSCEDGHGYECDCCPGTPGDEREQGLCEVHEQDQVGRCVPDGGVSADNCRVRQSDNGEFPFNNVDNSGDTTLQE